MSDSNLSYLVASARNWFRAERRKCPNCGAQPTAPVQRKRLITSLVRCGACRLLYRTPTDPPAHNHRFYQDQYTHGFTTDCPSEADLRALLANGFAGHEKDYAPNIELLKALGARPGAKLFDFGCSWGYGSWQLREAGYDVVSYEISEPRARYAREMLGMRLVDDLNSFDEPCDVFFSCHVLEHVPAPRSTINVAKRLLVSGGLFVALTPNGSLNRLNASPEAYRSHWGLLHPNMLDEQFYDHAFVDEPHLVAASDYDLNWIRSWNRHKSVVGNLTGGELLVAAVMGAKESPGGHAADT